MILGCFPNLETCIRDLLRPCVIPCKLPKIHQLKNNRIILTMKICTCNNCGNIYDDNNAGDESIEYVDTPLQELDLLNEDGESFWGCGVCGTDGNLTDNININAMSEEQKEFAITIKEALS